MQRLKKHTLSFGYAWRGILYAIRTQPNFGFHLFAALLVIVLGFYFNVSAPEWLALLLTISVVLTTEMLNTALETVTDALKEHKKTEKDDFYIMVAKDIGAGAVLIAAAAAATVGLIVFVPKIITF